VSFIPFLVILSLVYPWINDFDQSNALINRISPPHGFERAPASDSSFAQWLRNIPLKSGNPPVMLFNGQQKRHQLGHHAIVDIDIGTNDLQQCADAIIRLYAEYLYGTHQFEKIAFLLTNGDTASFLTWSVGYRPRVADDVVTWRKGANPDSTYSAFQDYLRFVFTYAGTYSLSEQLSSVDASEEIRIGDVFVQGGFPGHAVLVVDIAVNSETGKKVFLLCQSYMPAQDIHILKNLNDSDLSPWYALSLTDTLYIPEWTFLRSDLKRF